MNFLLILHYCNFNKFLCNHWDVWPVPPDFIPGFIWRWYKHQQWGWEAMGLMCSLILPAGMSAAGYLHSPKRAKPCQGKAFFLLRKAKRNCLNAKCFRVRPGWVMWFGTRQLHQQVLFLLQFHVLLSERPISGCFKLLGLKKKKIYVYRGKMCHVEVKHIR